MAEKEARYNEIKDTDPAEADKLFPAKVNHYCGGCDHLIGCPREEEIRTQYRDYVMNLEAQEEPLQDEEPDPDETEEEKKNK